MQTKTKNEYTCHTSKNVDEIIFLIGGNMGKKEVAGLLLQGYFLGKFQCLYGSSKVSLQTFIDNLQEEFQCLYGSSKVFYPPVTAR